MLVVHSPEEGQKPSEEGGEELKYIKKHLNITW